ncbi:hypothetical protein OSB04_025175 [Centaurea solstitialis]|uniref:SWIM-type domain-containing protein n=1 Tax=Centaurea solstitialis TaxID=347529 RepID=A0AA38T710_9ASTR|nr:hypothetical protein OSB04_025175 [Centaurea solstitialis]
MENSSENIVDETSKPMWENMVESPIVEHMPLSKYKLKLKYGGFFRLAKNSSKKIYCFGSQKCIYIETWSYNLTQLREEVIKRYSSKNNPQFSIVFLDKNAPGQSFIELDSEETFMVMLHMYVQEKEVIIYVTTENNHDSNKVSLSNNLCDNRADPNGEDDSDYCVSEESYHSHLSSDNEDELMNYEDEDYSCSNNSLSMKVNSKFANVIEFRRALNHYAITNEFDYLIVKSDPIRFTARCEKIDCEWKIHASIMQDGVTFEVKTMVEGHTCTRSNKGGHKRATQGWIASVVTSRLKSDGDVTVAELRKWLMRVYNVDVPYQKVFRGKEQAYSDMYGKWEDSFMKMDGFREELLNRNQGTIAEIDFDIIGDKKRFKRLFISLGACSRGFLAGCRPYIALDACHLKGKFNGVLAAATGIDGNNSIFPIAYCVLESENALSWTWFLESLKKAIGTPHGLVISSDMQKGLGVAMMNVYPNVEHRECIRHLYSNFKKHFHGEFFSKKLWGAAKTYRLTEYDRLLKEIGDVRQDAITYLNENHNKIWSRSKFGMTSKCDYITNNISETFNSWIGELRYQPVLDLLDAIREKIMKRFDKKRRVVKNWNGSLVPIARNYLNSISKNLGEYEVCRSSNTQAEVKCKGRRWEVSLDERKCSCRVWQVKGLPCVHVAAFIAFIRDDWEKYVDPYFSIEKYKEAYALEIAPMPSKDQWMEKDGEKIYPPIIRRPAGRPKKNRIKPSDESKRRHKCPRCGKFGHREKTCKNPASQDLDPNETSTSKRIRGKNSRSHESSTSTAQGTT